MEGLTKWVFDLVFQPGSSLRLVPAINGSLFALLLLLAWAAWYKVIESVHLIVLSVLSIGLMASVSWFAYEFQKAKASQDAEKEGAVGKVAKID
jgi:hypothetical protein